LASQGCIWSNGIGGTQAIAIFHRLKRPGRLVDFAKREQAIPAGALYVEAFAALSPATAHATMLGLMERAKPGDLWVEIFEEDAIVREAVASAGLVYQGSKILAGGEVKGVYATRPATAYALDAVEEATLSVLAPEFLSNSELAEISAELAQGAPFAQHYSSYNKRGTWEAFALRGYRPSDPCFIIKPAEMSRAWKKEHPADLLAVCADTTIAPLFGAVKRVADRLSPLLDRVRFMRLRAGGGELTRHADITDRQAGVQDGCVIRLHIPIVTNPAVRFSAWNARGVRTEAHFPVGALCYLDQRKPHTAINGGADDRVHLVIDAFANDYLRSLIRSAA
jgi:hypothetical protein